MPNEHCGCNKVQRSAVVWHELLKLRKGVWAASAVTIRLFDTLGKGIIL